MNAVIMAIIAVLVIIFIINIVLPKFAKQNEQFSAFVKKSSIIGVLCICLLCIIGFDNERNIQHEEVHCYEEIVEFVEVDTLVCYENNDTIYKYKIHYHK